jgi:hypothetical protein
MLQVGDSASEDSDLLTQEGLGGQVEVVVAVQNRTHLLELTRQVGESASIRPANRSQLDLDPLQVRRQGDALGEADGLLVHLHQPRPVRGVTGARRQAGDDIGLVPDGAGHRGEMPPLQPNRLAQKVGIREGHLGHALGVERSVPARRARDLQQAHEDQRVVRGRIDLCQPGDGEPNRRVSRWSMQPVVGDLPVERRTDRGSPQDRERVEHLLGVEPLLGQRVLDIVVGRPPGDGRVAPLRVHLVGQESLTLRPRIAEHHGELP